MSFAINTKKVCCKCLAAKIFWQLFSYTTFLMYNTKLICIYFPLPTLNFSPFFFFPSNNVNLANQTHNIDFFFSPLFSLLLPSQVLSSLYDKCLTIYALPLFTAPTLSSKDILFLFVILAYNNIQVIDLYIAASSSNISSTLLSDL